MENPIISTGYQTFRFTIPEDMRRTFQETIGKAITDTHSLYFNILAEMGIAGLGVILYLFYVAARSGWRLFRLADDGFLKGLGLGFFLCVIACFLTNVFGDRWSTFQNQGFYWIFWALTERGIFVAREQANTKVEVSNNLRLQPQC